MTSNSLCAGEKHRLIMKGCWRHNHCCLVVEDRDAYPEVAAYCAVLRDGQESCDGQRGKAILIHCE